MLASSSLASASMDLNGKGHSSSAEASMAALAAAAAAGDDGSDSGGAEVALPPRGEEGEKPAKVAAVGGSSPASARRGGAAGGASSSSMAAARRGAAAAAAAIAAVGGGLTCQADRCNADMSKEDKRYNRKHKVCELHHKAPVVLVAGLRQRFCQQCSRFHELSEFDDAKRSCRQRLAGHNERRRRNSADANGNGDSRHADQDGRGPPGNQNHFQIIR